MAILAPYDKSILTPIANAITASLGISASNDGSMIRVIFPELSATQRQELIKTVKGKGEDAKIGVRNARRDGLKALDDLKKSKVLTEDDLKRVKDNVQSLVKKYEDKVEDEVKKKTVEIMEI